MAKHALLHEDVVVYIANQYERDNSEEGIHEWVALSHEDESVVKIGHKYNRATKKFERVRSGLESEKERLLKKNLSIYRAKMEYMLKEYDMYEIMTFPYQTQDLLQYQQIKKTGQGDMWFMPALAMGRWIPLDPIMQRLEAKIKQFCAVMGFVTGIKQRHEDNIEAIENYRMVDEVDDRLDKWSITNDLESLQQVSAR